MQELKTGILDVLDMSRGYDTALLTTFNFEIEFFEKVILSRLVRNNIRKVSVFVDAKELSKSLSNARSGCLGQRYAINPVSMSGSFHPKVILLLGKNRARLIVSSANLKLTGYCINNEIFDYIDYDEEHPAYRDLIVKAIRFFDYCNQFTPQLDNALLTTIRKAPYNRKAPANGQLFFLENTSNSVLDQLKDIIQEPVETITVAAPYYDNDLLGLKAINNSFPTASIFLYLQHGKSTFPEAVQTVFQKDLKVFEKVKAPGNENSHFYHGKVFLFKCEKSSYVLYGSSNCTQSALTKTKSEGGNIEANLLLKGTYNEFDDFFEQFDIAEKLQPESQIMSFSSIQSPNYYYKYGVASKTLTLHIGYLQEYSPVFLVGDRILKWVKKDNEIVIETDLLNLDCIFSLAVQYDGKEEILHGWYINRDLLELNRIEISTEDTLKDSESFGIGEKFLPDYEKLLHELDSCKMDYINTREALSPFMNINGLQEEVETDYASENEEDYIINVELTDSDYIAYNKFRLAVKIRNRIISRYFSSGSLYFGPAIIQALTPLHKGQMDSFEESSKPRQATSEEKRFERFVKRCVRGILDPEFAEIADVDHYFGLIAVVFEIIEKYRKEKVDGIFRSDYIVTTRCALLTLFLNKSIQEWKYRDDVIIKIFDIILNNHEIIQDFESIEIRGKYEQENRKLLLALDNKFSIRENFSGYILKDLESAKTIEGQNKLKHAIFYTDQLFGYMTLNQIQTMMRKNLGKSSAIVPIKGSNNIYVLVFTETPGKYLKPETSLIREFSRYSKHYKRVDKIIIEFKKQHPSKYDRVARVKHDISLERRIWSYTVFDGNDKAKQYPSSYLSW